MTPVLSRVIRPSRVRGRIVWLAGQTGFRDEQGKEVVGFDAQARQAFKGIDAVLMKAGGSLAADLKS